MPQYSRAYGVIVCPARLVPPGLRVDRTGPGLLHFPRGRFAGKALTMRYIMKQKLFSWGDDFTIKDEDGKDIYFVDGKAFSFGKQLSFQDMDGNELAFIKQKLLSWGPTYEIYRDGNLCAVVKKKLFTFFKCEFTIDLPGPDDPIAEGDFLHHEYVFRRSGEIIGTVSKQWFTFTDTYGVEIAPDQDDVLLLASTVVIDMACHSGDHKH